MRCQVCENPFTASAADGWDRVCVACAALITPVIAERGDSRDRSALWNQPSGTWYHASAQRLALGTVLVADAARNPASDQFYALGFGRDTGILMDMGARRDAVVWLSPDREEAVFWSLALQGPYLYEVQPAGEPRPWNGAGADGWVLCRATVLRELNAGHDGQGQPR